VEAVYTIGRQQQVLGKKRHKAAQELAFLVTRLLPTALRMDNKNLQIVIKGKHDCNSRLFM
jgi:DNA repair ATPase RecN